MFRQEASQKITLGLRWFKLLPQARHERFSSIGLLCFVVMYMNFLDVSLMSSGDDLDKRRGDKETFNSLNLLFGSDGHK